MCVCKYLDRYSEDGAAENTLTQIILNIYYKLWELYIFLFIEAEGKSIYKL